MKKLTHADKAEMKMESVIWNHGRKKAMITSCINQLKQTTIADHPDILKAIKTLESERERLKKVELF